MYGPFPFAVGDRPGTCGYETWEVLVDKGLDEYLSENMIIDNENTFIGFKTEPQKGKIHQNQLKTI